MIYKSGIFILYAVIHIFLCVLHYQMGIVDRLNGDTIKANRGFGKCKAMILSLLVFSMSLASFIVILVENKSVDSYDDEDDLKFERRHGVRQMRNVELCLNSACVILNFFFVRNFSKMVTRATRDKGSTQTIHYIALFISSISILIILAMIVATFFPVEIEVYRYL